MIGPEAAFTDTQRDITLFTAIFGLGGKYSCRAVGDIPENPPAAIRVSTAPSPHTVLACRRDSAGMGSLVDMEKPVDKLLEEELMISVIYTAI